MLSYEDMLFILGEVSYKDWTHRLIRTEESIYFQWEFFADEELQTGRKWLMSKHMTKSEVVATAFKAALTAEEHECREEFRYRGKKIFGPHFNVDILAEIAGKKVNLDLREKVTA